MIKIKNVRFQYANTEDGSLRDISLCVAKGECILLCGESGSGKTTLTRLINGLIPHYYEGNLSGEISVGDLDVKHAELYETAQIVGSVFQNPRSQFFCVDTTGEVAFGCENLGMPPEEIHKRVDLATDEMQVKELLGRNIFRLSGGEKQKIACASVAATQPDIFVLDEPTSNLDIHAIETLKETLQFWKAQGKTILISEHRLYWLRELCDRVIYLRNGKIERDIPMEIFRSYTSETLSELGLRALSLDGLQPSGNLCQKAERLCLKEYRYTYRGSNRPAMDIQELILPKCGVIAVIGGNGAGKSTFAKGLCGLLKRFTGTCHDGMASRNSRRMLKTSYMVMQDVNHQLFCESVEEELRLGMETENEVEMEWVMTALELTALRDRHPLSLSGGQKQRVAIASALLAYKQYLVFDEPTSGLDFRNMKRTARLLSSLGEKQTVFIVTHDPELILRCCGYVLQLKDGCVKNQYTLDKDGVAETLRFFAE